MLAPERLSIANQVDRLRSLTPGRTGNLSVRRDHRVAITPSGVPYEDLDPTDVPVVALDGEHLWGELSPSSETPMHRGIYRQFDTGAVAHVHSPWATTLAVLGKAMPPVHYMIALAGNTVPVAKYATYGTEELANNVVEAMAGADSKACLLANHGLVATGTDAASAIETAVAVESVAQVYCQAQSIGTPQTLTDAQIEAAARQFAEYGPERTERS